jgi:pyridoxine kinase
MPDYLQALESLSIDFGLVACGFLGNVRQIALVEAFLRKLHNTPLFLLDPVMGDHGRTYSTIVPEHCECLLGLVKYADILTPNITEACLLTGSPYKAGEWTIPELKALCPRWKMGPVKKSS